jgi:hypothetical protein
LVQYKDHISFLVSTVSKVTMSVRSAGLPCQYDFLPALSFWGCSGQSKKLSSSTATVAETDNTDSFYPHALCVVLSHTGYFTCDDNNHVDEPGVRILL